MRSINFCQFLYAFYPELHSRVDFFIIFLEAAKLSCRLTRVDI